MRAVVQMMLPFKEEATDESLTANAGVGAVRRIYLSTGAGAVVAAGNTQVREQA